MMRIIDWFESIPDEILVKMVSENFDSVESICNSMTLDLYFLGESCKSNVKLLD